MMCPSCQNDSTRVIDSRPADQNQAIRRRRECENCGYRFTTFERVELSPLLVIKKNGDREAFDRNKLLRGIVRSSEKRPIAMETMENIVGKVEANIRASGLKEVESTKIGELVMDELVELDDVAYIRFASVYREFTDREVFLKEIERLNKKNPEPEKED